MASFTEAATDAFTYVDRTVNLGSDSSSDNGPAQLFPKFGDITSAKLSNPILQLLDDLRVNYPEYVVTYADTISLNLLAFAFAGNATATLDIESDSIFRMRAWQQPAGRGKTGQLAEARGFAKYRYRWGKEDFILYCVVVGCSNVQATWDKVILDPSMKKELKSVSRRFFDSKDVYADLGVPWKRGLIFYGPAGNGKTISIKALMHTLADRKDSIPTLYVKTAPNTIHIRNVFALARVMSPCLLVLEDIDTIVTAQTRSYFFNEVDGLENNDGIMMVASTNHMDRLDPGLSKRPSRFDRKYLFPLPNREERVQYAQFWRQKLKPNSDVNFPEALVEPIADITHEFSFAYMQEAFVSSLLEIAHRHDDDDEGEDAGDRLLGGGGGDEDLEKYELWTVMKEQVKMLREEMDDTILLRNRHSTTPIPETPALPSHGEMEHDLVASGSPREISPHCLSCSAGPNCSSFNNSSPTHKLHTEAGYLSVQPYSLFSRPECLSFNESTNHLQGLGLFP
ncbi:P-loop containing nucleoside triphosphate hydrolase protein [Rhexocercosporidium sp. MPI-PUGE-AT-0058]|nr:P-loop containing nucleoside triphosphate hydrolase protein [Rhexocercosporidium sp. MPI-PUGE-AT-0058]